MIQGALIIDLELTRRGDLCALAGLRCDDDAVFKAEDLDARRRPDALRALAALGQGARLLVGHNLAAHDRPWLAERHPDHPLLRLPWADTLVLSPLAFPERPYHRLIKDHRLVRDSISAPLADCRACKVVLDDTIAALGARATARPALLAFLRAALTDPEVPQANAGYAAVFDAAGVPGGLGWAEAARALRATLDGLVCVEGERTIELTPSDALAFAYAASWLTVPPGSGLPAWVRVQFPATRALIDRLRGTPCRRQDCRFCRDHHEPEGWLQRVFGYPAFRPTPAAPDGGSLQRAIVEAGLRGEPLYAVLPTGTGKSACFQIPAIALHRAVGALTVVVSPLQSLMKDQVDQLRDREPFAGTINGSLTPPERERALEDVQAGATSLLYVSPEQIRNNGVRRALASRRIGAWVIDEAHCLSDWGHDFRTDYLYLPRYIRELAQRQGVPPPPVHCFTGTSQRAVTDSILALFQAELGQRLRVFDGGAERDNLVFHVIELPERDRPQRVLELLEEHLPERSAGAAIVFCATQKGTERAAEWLKAHGHAAEAYHAGLDGQTRRDVQDRFLRGELQVIAATSAFGMGVDKPDVRLVVHLDIPGSLEAYLQQAGRAGRDREEAHCVLLFSPGDIDTQFRLASRSQLTLRELQALWRGLQRVPSARERDAAGEIELRVVTRGELARLDAVAGLFDPNDPMTDTRINAAVSWLERGGLFERDENHTRVFQGKPKLPTLAAAEQRVAELDLPAPKAAQWRAILRRLYDAADDEGLSADDLAALALGVDAGDPLGAGARVLDVLHQMAEAGLVTSGVQMTAFLAWGVADPSTERLERLLTAQGHLLHELRARAPDPDGWLEASPRLIADQLAASGVEVRPERVVQLLRALERDGLGYDAQARSADLRWQGRDRMQVMLRRGWSEIVELARSNATAARALLADLERRTGGTKGKNVLVSFSVDELVRVLQGTLTLAGRLRSAPQAVDQALLLMHDARVLTLQGGLAVFRQAMALRRRQDAPRTLLAEKIEPLRHHEAERTVQIHVVDAYARLGASAIDEAQALARDWFGAPRDVFLQRWFPKQREVLRVGTSAESYRRIVDGVDEAQRPIVSAAPGANLLVLAGPGSGKTRVLVHRVAWLIRVRRVRPESVVVVCYTRANAIELRRRLRALIDVDARGVLVTTLHGLALRLTGRSPGHDELDFEGLLADAAAILRRERVPDGAEADEIRDLVLRGCAHLLVDEYQDLDAHQASLLDAIAGRSEADEDQRLSFLAVGDDDQSIFQFRGGTSTWIRDFARTWGATTHTLTRCYRCAPAILAAAEAMIRPVPGRLKAGTPLRVDDARADAPSAAVERVWVDEASAGAAVAARIAALREADPATFDIERVAVLSRTRDALGRVRYALAQGRVRCRWPLGRDERVSLARVREVASILDMLHERGAARLTLDEAKTEVQRVAPEPSPWRELLDRWVDDVDATWGAEGAPAPWLSRVLWEALATERGDRAIGQGVRLGTLHGAKGLEWDHVILVDDGGGLGGDAEEDARRLLYVGMTRARRTLTLLVRADRPHPALASLPRDLVVDRDRRAPPLAADAPDVRYGLLNLDDIWIDGLGRRPDHDPGHAALAELPFGAPLRLERDGRGLRVVTLSGAAIAWLAGGAVEAWGRRLDAGVDLRLVAAVRRDASQTDGSYRSKLKVERWLIPVCEARWRGP